MKKIATVLALCFALQNFAQEIVTVKTDSLSPKNNEDGAKGLHLDVVWRIYYASPNQFGDHVWNDAYRSGFSMGTSLGLLKFQNFRITGGFEIEQYGVRDVSKVGNFERVSKHSFFGTVSYDYKLSDRFMVVPNIGLGSKDISHKMKSVRVAHQTGNHIRMGIFCDYSLGKNADVFVGVHYINSKFDININKDYKDYYEKSTQLQLTLGLKVY